MVRDMRRSATFASFNELMRLLMYHMPRYTHREEILRLRWRLTTVLVDYGATTWTSWRIIMMISGESAHNLLARLARLATYVAS